MKAISSQFGAAIRIGLLSILVSCEGSKTTGIMEEQITLRNGRAKINYQKSGTGKTTILFLHGWCINSAYWNAQLTHFSKDHKVYAIDLPGFGKSIANRDNWTIEEYAQDVLDFIDQLELRKVVLIGHSMSGAVMMEAALKDPTNIIGLVGVDNFKFIDVVFTSEQTAQMESFFSLLKNDFKTHAPMFAENMLFHPSTSDEIKTRVKTDFSSADPTIGYNSFMNLMQYSRQEASRLESLQFKLNLINSDFPPTNKSGLENRCKNNFEIRSVGMIGHYPMIEKPEQFNKELEVILEKISQHELND